MENKRLISVAPGDGVGPEIMSATLAILKAAHARVEFEELVIGQQAYLSGYDSGISPAAWDSIRQNKVLLSGPVIASVDCRYKSTNVILRKMLGMYANVRDCVSLAPFVPTQHPAMNLVIIRENEEDLYAGLAYRQTADLSQSTRLISRPGCEKIVRYAFEYARSHYRKKVTCFSKDTLMKMTDGLFHKVFNAIAQEYPEIEHEHWVVDMGTAKLAETPEQFDVLVAPNLYGDILNNLTAQLAGSIGLAGSANFGAQCAMFETVHGAAPHRAGQNSANPSGLLQAAVMMLNHIGQPDIAEWIHNAWLRTLEDGIHTDDIYHSQSRQRVGTAEFAEAVIERLGQEPEQLAVIRYEQNKPLFQIPPYKRPQVLKQLVGVDVFFDWRGAAIDTLASQLQFLSPVTLELKLITNRGAQIWPEGFAGTFCTDHWRCRFLAKTACSHSDIIQLLGALAEHRLDFIKTEHLYRFDGERGYSLANGELAEGNE